MFIKDESIQAVRSVSISDIVGRFVKLKKKGANYTGLCPFHNEKSPSFNVSEAKGIYKCFGCGESGDVIQFIMKHERLNFLEAIEKIASLSGIPLQYEEVPDKEKYEAEKSEKERLKEVISFAVQQYRQALWKLGNDGPVAQYLADRGMTEDVISKWQIGWATDEWQYLAPQLINKNWYNEATKIGLIKRSKDDRNYDVYHGRLIFPITNKHGEFIGLGGRTLPGADKNAPKYINSPESPIYSKGKELYGLSHAIRGIERESFAFLVEGYTDVIAMHENGDDNTVATNGTALTIDQAKLLARYTKRIVILRDGDAAGKKAVIRDLSILVKEGFKVEVIILPEGEDPDSMVSKIKGIRLLKAEGVTKVDAVLWRVNELVSNARGDSHEIAEAKEIALELLASMSNALIRGEYLDQICYQYKWRRQDMERQLKAITDLAAEDDEDEVSFMDKMPKWMDKEEFQQNGYCRVKTDKRVGYYSFNNGTYVQYTNFLITPLYHVYAGINSKYLIEIDNGRKRAVLEMEAKAIIDRQRLQDIVVNEGPFMIMANNLQMQRVFLDLLEQFPRCEEVKFLGWQQQGFFAFVNCVYMPGAGIVQIDNWGIVTHEKNSYLIPPASAAYKHLAAKGDDPYEADRFLQYRPSEISFQDWAAQMKRVYFEKGNVAIAFIILSIFRDIIFQIDNNCPHLYGFGERSSGKSKWADSVCAVFYNNRSAFNLNSGTDFAFNSYMQRFQNCPAQLNEFDEKVIKPEWFQAIKGVFDGEGRHRGSLSAKNKVEVQRVLGTLVLIGQYICTMDDNSIVSRSIIEAFSEREFTDADKQEMIKLKDWESAGLSNIIIEILKYRHHFKAVYRDKFNATLSEWRQDASISKNLNQRILQNWCHLYTCWEVIAEFQVLPTTNKEFRDYCKKSAGRWSNFIRSSDTLSEFWSTFQYLVDQGQAVEGWDFKIQQLTSITIENANRSFVHEFLEPTKVLFLRINNVHKMYESAYRMRTGKQAITRENIQHYFSSRKYFIGLSKSSRFRRFINKSEQVNVPGVQGSSGYSQVVTQKEEEVMVSSSHVFVLDELGIEIERLDPGEEDQPVPGAALGIRIKSLLDPGKGFKPVDGADF